MDISETIEFVMSEVMFDGLIRFDIFTWAATKVINKQRIKHIPFAEQVGVRNDAIVDVLVRLYKEVDNE